VRRNYTPPFFALQENMGLSGTTRVRPVRVKADELRGAGIAQIEQSVRGACERPPNHAESVEAALQFQRRAMSQDERAVLLSLEIFAGEAANLAAWLLHLRGDHEDAREVVHAAHRVQQAVSAALEPMALS